MALHRDCMNAFFAFGYIILIPIHANCSLLNQNQLTLLLSLFFKTYPNQYDS